MVAKKKNADAPATKKYLLQLKIKAKHDEIIRKIDDMRIEKLLPLIQSRRQDETITNHEERIVRLEHKVLV